MHQYADFKATEKTCPPPPMVMTQEEAFAHMLTRSGIKFQHVHVDGSKSSTPYDQWITILDGDLRTTFYFLNGELVKHDIELK